MVPKGEVGGGKKDWAFGISRCKLLHLEWINNKVLLYSTGENIQFACVISSFGLCNPMDCSLLGSSIHGIFQARILE